MTQRSRQSPPLPRRPYSGSSRSRTRRNRRSREWRPTISRTKPTSSSRETTTRGSFSCHRLHRDHWAASSRRRSPRVSSRRSRRVFHPRRAPRHPRQRAHRQLKPPSSRTVTFPPTDRRPGTPPPSIFDAGHGLSGMPLRRVPARIPQPARPL